MTDSIDTNNTDVELYENSRSNVDVTDIISGLNSGVSFFSTVKGDDVESRLIVMDALTDSKPIDENIGKTINLANFVVQPVELMDDRTGELTTQPRIVLIDADGTGYHATSVGLLSSLRNILAALSPLSLSDLPGGALPVAVSRVKSRNNSGSFFTLKRVRPAAK